MNYLDFTLVFKALGDATRLQIVEMLSGNELCACKILEKFDITQPTLSHHMKSLTDCGIVNVRKDGKWSHYSLNENVLQELKRYLSALKVSESGDCSCQW